MLPRCRSGLEATEGWTAACRVWGSSFVADRVEHPLNFTCMEQPSSLGFGDGVEEPVAHDHVAAIDECPRDCR